MKSYYKRTSLDELMGLFFMGEYHGVVCYVFRPVPVVVAVRSIEIYYVRFTNRKTQKKSEKRMRQTNDTTRKTF